MARGSSSGEDLPDLSEFYVPQVEVDDSAADERRAKQGRIKERFLRGPIPLKWLRRACELSGKELATALAIWYLSGLRDRRKKDLNFTSQTAEELGVDRSSKSRGLAALEEAGLIRVRRNGKKNPLVTILDV